MEEKSPWKRQIAGVPSMELRIPWPSMLHPIWDGSEPLTDTERTDTAPPYSRTATPGESISTMWAPGMPGVGMPAASSSETASPCEAAEGLLAVTGIRTPLGTATGDRHTTPSHGTMPVHGS